MTGASIIGIIINKFGHRQKPGPIILFEIDKCIKIYFYTIVLPFGLAICVKIKCGG